MYTYEYPRPSVTTDCVIFTSDFDLEKFDDININNIKVLLIRRKNNPYANYWAIPGGFLEMNETTENCAIRELEEETGFKTNKIHLVNVFSKINRDPRGRVISITYYKYVKPSKITKVIGGDDAVEADWFTLNSLPILAFDHKEILTEAYKLFKSHNS